MSKKHEWKTGEQCHVSGDSYDLGITDYNVRVDTNGIVEEDQQKYAKNILVTLDCIDNDHNVCADVPIRSLKVLDENKP